MTDSRSSFSKSANYLIDRVKPFLSMEKPDADHRCGAVPLGRDLRIPIVSISVMSAWLP